MNAKLHNQAKSLARKINQDPDMEVRWHRKKKLWIFQFDGSIELYNDRELIEFAAQLIEE